MKNSQLIKNGFYIKVNKKLSPKKENLPEKDLMQEEKFKTKTYNIPKSIYFTETKQNNSQIKSFLSPMHKQIKLFKSSKSKEKLINQNNTTPINKKYKRKIIHIENKNKLNMIKSQTQFPLNTKNYLSKSEKNFAKFKSFLNQKNIIHDSVKNSNKLTTKLNNNEQNSTINLSKKKLKNNLYYPNLKYMQFHVGNKLIGIPNYSKTIMNNNNSQSKTRKKISKKIRNKSKENSSVKKYEKNIIDIYKSKLVTIFVKLMNDYFKKKIKKIFNLFIYKIKDNFYFIYANKTYNKKNNNLDNKKIYENEIYDYNTKINYLNNYGYNLSKPIFPYNDYQSMTMYHYRYNKNNDNNKNICTSMNNRYEEDIIQNNEGYYNNYNSNDKYNIFKNMKIEKHPKNVLNNDFLNKNQNINNQINNFYNTKNTNYYFNKINSFNSLIIEKQRPRYYNPKNNIGYISPRKINNFSLNKKKNVYTNIIKLKSNNKNDLINSVDKSKNLIYKKIVSKDNKNRINHEKYDIIMNQTEKLIDKKKTFINYKNIINKNNINNYYTSINQYQGDYNYNNGDISNDINNYCLEDIDKPMNMIYSINDFEDEEDNDEKNKNKNLNQNQINDKISMKFNYVVFQPKKNGKEFIYKNKILNKKNQLTISKGDSIFFLNKYRLENKININSIIEKIKNILNNLIYIYKLKFFKIFKYIKFKSIICTIIENRKIDIIKKCFDVFKKYEIAKREKKIIKPIQDNKDLKINPEENIENNIDIKNETEKIYSNKIELFRINILKFIFSKK